MLAIFKREIRAYFTTPIGYIFIGIFLAISGGIFAFCTLQLFESSDPYSYFQFLLFGFVVLIPLLTMKLFSEERKLKTEQLLLTAPVRLMSMVLAKFLAAYTMFSITFLVSCCYFMILPLYGYVNGAIVAGNIISILLVGAAFIAIGVFVSSLSENQLNAAIGTIAILLILMVISFANSYIEITFIRQILGWLSIFSRYFDFTNGVFNYSALLYYASIAFVFLFLTVRVYEKRRWD